MGIKGFLERSGERDSDNLFAINECIALCQIITLTRTLVFLPHPHFLNSLSGEAGSKIASKTLESAARAEMLPSSQLSPKSR